jgi:YbbR domain-containing protein
VGAALRHNRGLKIISLLLAFFLWYSINVSERDAERVLELPVVVRKLPPDLIVVSGPDRAVSATLRGPRTILDWRRRAARPHRDRPAGRDTPARCAWSSRPT